MWALPPLNSTGELMVRAVPGPDVFTARPVSPSRRHGASQGITAGLAAGETYAAANSFVLKAELGKGALAVAMLTFINPLRTKEGGADELGRRPFTRYL